MNILNICVVCVLVGFCAGQNPLAQLDKDALKEFVEAARALTEAALSMKRTQERLDKQVGVWESMLPFMGTVMKAGSDTINVVKGSLDYGGMFVKFDCGGMECEDNITALAASVCEAKLYNDAEASSSNRVLLFLRGYLKERVKSYVVSKCGFGTDLLIDFVDKIDDASIILMKPRGIWLDSPGAEDINNALNLAPTDTVTILELKTDDVRGVAQKVRGVGTPGYHMLVARSCGNFPQRAYGAGEKIVAFDREFMPGEVVLHITTRICGKGRLYSIDKQHGASSKCASTAGKVLGAFFVNQRYISGAIHVATGVVATVYHGFKAQEELLYDAFVCFDGVMREVFLIGTKNDVAWFSVEGLAAPKAELAEVRISEEFTLEKYTRSETGLAVFSSEVGVGLQIKLLDSYSIDYKGRAVYAANLRVDNTNSGGALIQDGKVVGMLTASGWMSGAWFVPAHKLNQ